MTLTFNVSPQLPTRAYCGYKLLGGCSLSPANGSDAYGAKVSINGLPPEVTVTFPGIDNNSIDNTWGGFGINFQISPQAKSTTHRVVLNISHRSGNWSQVFPLQICTSPVLPPPVFYNPTPALSSTTTNSWRLWVYNNRNSLSDVDGDQSGPAYYDGDETANLAAVYFNDNTWTSLADNAHQVYLNVINDPSHSPGGIPGYWVFPRGLYRRAKRGDSASLLALNSIATNSEFMHAGGSYSSWTNPDCLREMSFALETYICLTLLGEAAYAASRELYLECVLGMLDQCFVSRTYNKIKPFMAALAVRALWYYWNNVKQDTRIPVIILETWRWLQENAWCPSSQSFWYSNFDEPEQGNSLAYQTATLPLNVLIATIGALAFSFTGKEEIRTIADAAFVASVACPIYQTKEFNQLVLPVFDYLQYRQTPTGQDLLTQLNSSLTAFTNLVRSL